MAAWLAAARQAGYLSRLSSLTSTGQAAKLIQRRGLAGGADHGPPRVNCWDDPLSPSKWKEEHVTDMLETRMKFQTCLRHSKHMIEFVIVCLSTWGVIIYGGYKKFSSGGKKETLEEKTAEGAH